GFVVSRMAREGGSESTLSFVSTYTGIITLWERLTRVAPDVSENMLNLVRDAKGWLKIDGKPSAEVTQSLSAIVKFAEDFFRHNKSVPDQAYACVTFLDFLTVAEPSNDVRPYMAYAAKLEPFFSNAEAELPEVVLLVEHNPF